MGRKAIRQKQYGVMWVTALLLCICMIQPVFAESVDDGAAQQEQWVFLLAEPEDDSSCIFYAKPALAGYTTGEDTEVEMCMSISDKQYEIELYALDGSGGWYASGAYAIASDAWKMDYEMQVTVTDGEGVIVQEQLTNRDMTASWPKASEGKLELKTDENGRLENSEFEWDQWMEQEDSPLFTYKISSQNNCEIILDGDRIQIIQAENGGSFSIAAEDPSGNRRETQVNIVVADQTGTGAIWGIGAVALIIVIVAVVFVLKKKGHGSGHQSQIAEARKALDEKYQQLNRLLKTINMRKKEILETGKAAEERVRSEGSASADSLADVKALKAVTEDLEDNISYTRLSHVAEMFKAVQEDLQQMQGNIKPAAVKTEDPYRIVKNYLDETARRTIFDSLQADEIGVKALLKDLDDALQALREIVSRGESVFQKDLKITVSVGQREFTGCRTARNRYGASQPGVFSMDEIRFLSKDGIWTTLSEIVGKPTGIRIFAIAEDQMRAVAAQPVFHGEGQKIRVVSFNYDQPAVLVLDEVKITLKFE